MKYLILIALVVSMSSCVSLEKHKKGIREAVAAANKACDEISAMKDARLRSFKQLNPDGTLR